MPSSNFYLATIPTAHHGQGRWVWSGPCRDPGPLHGTGWGWGYVLSSVLGCCSCGSQPVSMGLRLEVVASRRSYRLWDAAK